MGRPPAASKCSTQLGGDGDTVPARSWKSSAHVDFRDDDGEGRGRRVARYIGCEIATPWYSGILRAHGVFDHTALQCRCRLACTQNSRREFDGAGGRFRPDLQVQCPSGQPLNGRAVRKGPRPVPKGVEVPCGSDAMAEDGPHRCPWATRPAWAQASKHRRPADGHCAVRHPLPGAGTACQGGGRAGPGTAEHRIVTGRERMRGAKLPGAARSAMGSGRRP